MYLNHNSQSLFSTGQLTATTANHYSVLGNSLQQQPITIQYWATLCNNSQSLFSTGQLSATTANHYSVLGNSLQQQPITIQYWATLCNNSERVQKHVSCFKIKQIRWYDRSMQMMPKCCWTFLSQ